MPVESAEYVQDAWGYSTLLLVIDGHSAWTDTKFSVLSAGIAILHDGAGVETPHWHNAATATWEHTPGFSVTLPGGTTDPLVVCLARRFFKACCREDFRPGPVPVPTKAEALAEIARGGWEAERGSWGDPWAESPMDFTGPLTAL